MRRFFPVAAFLAVACLLGCAAVATAQDNSASVIASQSSVAPGATSAVSRAPVPSEAPAQDLVFEGMGSYGNYRIFAGGENAHLYTGGLEYDRNSWGTFLKARMDYSAEVLPVMILNEPAVTDIWGDTKGPGRKILYGIGLSPAGLRMTWREKRAIKPYFGVKGGVLAFDQKVLTRASTYEDFTLQESAGMMVRVSPRYDLRLGLFGDFHFSNGFATNVNPGLDVMNYNVGIVYHLGSRRSGVARAR